MSESEPGVTSDLIRALNAELEDHPGIAETSLAAAARDLAARLARPGLAPSGAAMLHAQLGLRLAELRAITPAAETSDEIDEVAAQRDARRKAAGL